MFKLFGTVTLLFVCLVIFSSHSAAQFSLNENDCCEESLKVLAAKACAYAYHTGKTVNTKKGTNSNVNKNIDSYSYGPLIIIEEVDVYSNKILFRDLGRGKVVNTSMIAISIALGTGVFDREYGFYQGISSIHVNSKNDGIKPNEVQETFALFLYTFAHKPEIWEAVKKMIWGT